MCEGIMPNTKKTPRKSFMTAEQTERLACPFCPKTFRLKEDRDRHIIECTDTRLFCEFCNFNTNKRAYLNKHIKKAHCSVEQSRLSSDEEESAKPQDIKNDSKKDVNNNTGQPKSQKKICPLRQRKK